MADLSELGQLVKVATQFYATYLKSGSLAAATARHYLGERRVMQSSVDTFQIGYAPWAEGAPWIAERTGASMRDLRAAGLVVETQSGKFVDPMAGRVVFPQTNPAGQMVGFVGRSLSDTDNGYKYVATPQTDLFRRSEILYRIDLSFQPMLSLSRAVVVEGPLDAVLMWQMGQKHTVATGSARLTDAQAQILARYAKRLEVMFDRDPSGDEAFDQVRRQRSQYFMSVSRTQVPVPYKDPAEWIRSQIDRKLTG